MVCGSLPSQRVQQAFFAFDVVGLAFFLCLPNVTPFNRADNPVMLGV